MFKLLLSSSNNYILLFLVASGFVLVDLGMEYIGDRIREKVDI